MRLGEGKGGRGVAGKAKRDGGGGGGRKGEVGAGTSKPPSKPAGKRPPKQNTNFRRP